MKGILVIMDGIADLPCRQLKDKTPLQVAEKPNLDKITSFGKLGQLYSIKPGVTPESDSAILSILGNDYAVGYRGQLEALGAGIEVKHGDLAIRINFATIDNLKDKNIIDRRAGRNLTTKEARSLADEINKKVKLNCNFIFQSTSQHRGVLVLKGGFSDNITNTDPAYHDKGKSGMAPKFKFSQALDEEEISHFTSNIVNDFIEKSHKVLDSHEINQQRRIKGLYPANIILTRDSSIDLPKKLKKMENWAAVTYMPVEKGIAKALKMNNFSFNYPDLKGYDVYDNLYRGLLRACSFALRVIKRKHKKFDYFYVHFKETDVPGHDNKPLEKKKMIEVIDKHFFSYLVRLAEKNHIKIIVTGDHATPCKLKGHSDDPIPLLFCDCKKRTKKEQKFDEVYAKKGELGKILGKEMLSKLGF
jgi:2,3-bisphosphoglycerate-independent phosphoglycerate mutase